jgi:hypothetical protein
MSGNDTGSSKIKDEYNPVIGLEVTIWPAGRQHTPVQEKLTQLTRTKKRNGNGANVFHGYRSISPPRLIFTLWLSR